MLRERYRVKPGMTASLGPVMYPGIFSMKNIRERYRVKPGMTAS